MKRRRRLGVLAAACAGLTTYALPEPAVATPTAATAPAPTSTSDSAVPAPVKFRLTLRLSGGYASHLTAPDHSVARSITFASAPALGYDVYLYPAGAPPAYLRTAIGVQRSLTSGMRGRWSTEVTGAQACEAGGTLVDSSSGTSPLVATAQYRRREYAVMLQAAPDTDPFSFLSTHAGTDPCATTDPWGDWVVSFGQVRDRGAATFHVGLTLTQSQLQAAARGQQVSVPVRLRPSGGLRSSDCGTVPLLGVSCRQSLGWAGRVTVSRSHR